MHINYLYDENPSYSFIHQSYRVTSEYDYYTNPADSSYGTTLPGPQYPASSPGLQYPASDLSGGQVNNNS